MTTAEADDASAAAAATLNDSSGPTKAPAAAAPSLSLAGADSGGVGSSRIAVETAAATQANQKAGRSSDAKDEDDGDDTKMEVDEEKGDDHDVNVDALDRALLEDTLFRLTRGLPRHELQTAVEEANAVEELLLREIQELERALRRSPSQKSAPKGASEASGEREEPALSRGTSGEGAAAMSDKKEAGQPAAKRKKEETEGEERTKGDVDAERAADEGEDDDGDDEEAAVRLILESCPFTPLDGYWTISALLGRLRDMSSLPQSPVPRATLAASAPTANATGGAGNLPGDATVPTAAAGGGGGGGGPTTGGRSPKNEADDESDSSPRRLLELENHPDYAAVHDTPVTLLALHKKITSHRSSAVFKKPVKVEDAPGYDARILFPVDLASIRKQIVARQVVSFRDLHGRIGMIAHNCCKYNGRESDYGQVAREFERVGDELIRQAVLNPQALVPGTLQPHPTSQLGGRKSTPVAEAAAAVGGAGDHGGGETKVDSSDTPNPTEPSSSPTTAEEVKLPASAPTITLPTEKEAPPAMTKDPPPAVAPLPSAPKLPPSTAASLKVDDHSPPSESTSAKLGELPDKGI